MHIPLLDLTRRLLRSSARFTSEAQRALTLFRQMMKVAGNDGRPFAKVDYDYDSLENRCPIAMERALSMVADPMRHYFQSEVVGLKELPKGPLLFVGNHNGGAFSPEIFLFGGALFREHGLDVMPYGLAHETVIRIPPVARLLIPIGAVRASPKNAARVFESGRNVLVYPGGDEEAFRPSRQRDEIVFANRKGYIRLALRHGVPIVPVVTFGAHDIFVVLDDGRWLAETLGLDKVARLKVFPTMLSLPWGVTSGIVMPFIPLPARIRIEVLAPIHFARSGQTAAEDSHYVAACDEQVRNTMQQALTRMAQTLRHGVVTASDLSSFAPANDQVSLAVTTLRAAG